LAYDIKDVRTAMDPLDKQYQLVLIIILISLIIAAGISVLFTPGPEHDQKSDIFIQISQGDTGADVGKAEN
jgi:capsular polysaccharide biosynthesis protein